MIYIISLTFFRLNHVNFLSFTCNLLSRSLFYNDNDNDNCKCKCK